MKALLKILITLLFFLNSGYTFSQVFSFSSLYEGLSLSLTGNYVSSASIQLYPNSNNIVEKNSFEELQGGYGYGVSLRKKFFRDDLYIGITTEYIKIHDDELTQLIQNDTNFLKIRVTETVWMIPLELSLIFNIPSITDELRVYLGGGIGVYFGNRVRRILGMDTETKSRDALLNIHVLSGLEYFFEDNISALFEVRFRQAQYRVTSSYPTGQVVINGDTYNFAKDLNSKVFFDGLKLSAGLAFYIN
jgi:hypothetical protein